MGTKSRETIYGSSVRAAAEEARAARKEADRLACQAWNKRMLGLQWPAQPSPTISEALNAGYLYLDRGSLLWLPSNMKRSAPLTTWPDNSSRSSRQPAPDDLDSREPFELFVKAALTPGGHPS